jgi:hypothetical protein
MVNMLLLVLRVLMTTHLAFPIDTQVFPIYTFFGIVIFCELVLFMESWKRRIFSIYGHPVCTASSSYIPRRRECK